MAKSFLATFLLRQEVIDSSATLNPHPSLDQWPGYFLTGRIYFPPFTFESDMRFGSYDYVLLSREQSVIITVISRNLSH